jgi:acetyl esterase/lipase
MGVNACIDFYRALVSGGHDPKKIIIGGDSAGGGLAVAMCNELVKQKIPTPKMILLFSPWVDMTMSGGTIKTNVEHDLMITNHLLENASKMYCAGTNPKNAGVSPVFAKFRDFPPTYILAATDELLCDDAVMLHDAMERDGVDVYLSLWHDAQHAFIVGMHLFPESTAVLDNIREFVTARV